MKLQMSLRHWTPIALLFGCLTPALLHAQTPQNSQSAKPPENAAVGGKLSVDLMFTKPDALGVTLRHGAIIAGSVEVSLDGHKLQPGQDYNIDLDSGVVYLLVQTKPGAAVSTSYRYDPSRAGASTGVSASGLVPMKMDFGGGNSLGITLGMGLAERTADGSVMSSNIFGWSNSFSLGGNAALTGLMLVGERTQQQATSAFEYQGKTVAPGQGKSHLIMQNLGTSVGGGTISFNYQDVSQNFGGFSAVQANGYSAEVANQLAKEKGLKRMGFSMDKVNLGGLGFTNSYRTVGDQTGGIKWEDFGINAGGLSLNYKSQAVSQKFARFADLAEANRDQLARETGMSRKSMDAAYKLGAAGSLSYSNSVISDDTLGKGIDRSDFRLTSSRFNFDLGSQDVQAGFTRVSSLNDAEAPQWGKEIGLARKWMAFDSTVLGTGSKPLKFSQSSVNSPTGGMKNLDASVGAKGWGIEHYRRQVDPGFTALPNLKPDEINANIAAITNMYQKGGMPVTGDMAGTYFQSPGLTRDFTRVTVSPTSKWNFGFDSLRMQGQQDTALVNSFTMQGGGLNLSYRHEDLGKGFSELTKLMPFEQQKLGLLPGLDRTDLSLDANFRKGGKLSFGQTSASTATGGLDRQTLAYADRTMQFSMNSRSVGPNFTQVNQLVDPEAGILAQMVGLHQSDASLKWQVNSGLHIDASSWSGMNDTLTQKRNLSNVLVNWGPNKGTNFEFQRSSSDSNNPFDALLANILQRMSFAENMGKAGTLKFTQQNMQYDPTVSKLPDAKTSDLSYETKLNAATSLKTEQISTSYADGNHESTSANTLSTELSKKAGLSFTDIATQRTGAAPSERKHNVGFWMTLWGGVKFNLGMNDNLNDAGTSATSHTMSLTPGSIGNMKVGSANYVANSWQQGDRTQANSTISLSTVKPFNFGILKELKMNIGQDTAADNGAWLKENKTLGLAGKVGKNAFGYNYFGQMNNLGQRGADRTFTFATDQSEKSPLRANLLYKFRTMPGDQNIAIRNFSVTARPWKGLELTNEMVTNPELPRSDLLLGSLPQPIRVNKWKLDYSRDPNCKISGSWEEQRNDDTNSLSRLGGLTFTLYEKTGSPISIFVGVEQAGGNVPDHTANRWSLRWDQKPGPNQALSLFVGNVTYGGTLFTGEKHANLSVDFQYQYKFGTR
jgi:hypothetical protein